MAIAKKSLAVGRTFSSQTDKMTLSASYDAKQMQEVVKLNIAVKKIESVVMNSEKLGLVFCSITLFPTRNIVTTDRLLISDEAVRVIDVRR